jgi:hypothetical protein
MCFTEFCNAIQLYSITYVTLQKGLDFILIKKYYILVSSCIFLVEHEIKLHSFEYIHSQTTGTLKTLISSWNNKEKEVWILKKEVLI